MSEADNLPGSGVVVAVVPDLFFASRIVSTVERLGGSAEAITTPTALVRRLAESLPNLVLVDLAARGIDPLEMIRLAKDAGVPRLIVFGPHLDLGKRAAALAAGADRWVTNQRLLEALQAELAPSLPGGTNGRRGGRAVARGSLQDAETSGDPSER